MLLLTQVPSLMNLGQRMKQNEQGRNNMGNEMRGGSGGGGGGGMMGAMNQANMQQQQQAPPQGMMNTSPMVSPSLTDSLSCSCRTVTQGDSYAYFINSP